MTRREVRTSSVPGLNATRKRCRIGRQRARRHHHHRRAEEAAEVATPGRRRSMTTGARNSTNSRSAITTARRRRTAPAARRGRPDRPDAAGRRTIWIGTITPARLAQHRRLRLASERQVRERRLEDDDRVAHRDARDAGTATAAAAFATAVQPRVRRAASAFRATTGASSAAACPSAMIQMRRLPRGSAARCARSGAAARFSLSFNCSRNERRQLDPEHRDVGHDAERDFEQRRVEVPVPEEERHLPQAPPAADVESRRRGRPGCSRARW